MTKVFVKNFIIVSFFSVLLSRLLPHPPNFTSSIAIAFYLPSIFGLKYILVSLSAFILADFVLGTHNLIFFTWVSLILVGLLSRFFKKYYYRFIGIILSCFVFYFVTNFGVWLLQDLYEKNLEGMITCFVMALPFFLNTLIGSFLFALFIELILTFHLVKNIIIKINTTH